MYYLQPDRSKAHVLIFYRNFSPTTEYSHVGLGVNARHTASVLRKNGVHADVHGVKEPSDIADILAKAGNPTHAIIEALWVTKPAMVKLMDDFPNTHFVVRTHSQVGFLQVEAGAIALLREMLLLQENTLNLSVSANSTRLAHFLTKTYTSKCLYLPNLYDMSRGHTKRDTNHQHRTLRIGSFGALRLLKNHTTSAAAALEIAERRRSDLEFWITTHREENAGAKGILHALRHMFQGLHWAKLVEHPWEDWARFRRTVAHMDLCMQPSFTETFNLATADAVSEGVPVVTSHAIEWVPSHWQVDPDSASEVARVGTALLSDPQAAQEGQQALERYVQHGVEKWLLWLGSNPTL